MKKLINVVYLENDDFLDDYDDSYDDYSDEEYCD